MHWRSILALALVLPACGDDDGDDDTTAVIDAAPTEDRSAQPDAPVTDTDAGATFTLTVTATAAGTVTSAPGTLDCTDGTGVCTESFAPGTVVTLTATPGTDASFAGWAGACSGTANTFEVAVDADVSCAAVFVVASEGVDFIDPPTSVVPNQTEDDTAVQVFLEQFDIATTAPLPLDMHTPETFGPNLPPPAQLPAGVRAHVYFVHFDPVGTSGTVNSLITVEFPDPVLGIISSNANLDATDAVLGIDGLAYPDAGTHPDRGIELSQDSLTLSADRRTLTMDLRTQNSSDQLRVLTVAPGQSLVRITSLSAPTVPAPASVVSGATEATGITLFDEGTVVLAADLTVDATDAGRYDDLADLVPANIGAGGGVRSVLVHFDPPGTSLASATGSVTFERDIVGIIVTTPSLEASDGPVGASATTYPAAGTDPDRQTELARDVIVIGGDARSVRFSFEAQNAQDQLRIILVD